MIATIAAATTPSSCCNHSANTGSLASANRRASSASPGTGVEIARCAATTVRADEQYCAKYASSAETDALVGVGFEPLLEQGEDATSVIAARTINPAERIFTAACAPRCEERGPPRRRPPRIFT